MPADVSRLEFSSQAHLPLSTLRETERPGASRLPDDTVVVSADSHFSVSADIFYEKFPSHLKDRAPRVWLERGAYQVGFNGTTMLPAPTQVGIAMFDQRPGCTNIEARLADMDSEGVDKEIVFGNGTNALLTFADHEIREWVYRIYNEHLAELQSRAPGRFYGVGWINYWDVTATERSIAELKGLGLKTFMLPLKPGLDNEGQQIEYHSEKMEPFWDIVEDSGLPVVHHIGEVPTSLGRNGIIIHALEQFAPFRRPFGQYIFGGILDRNPKLKIAWIEAGLNWALSAMQDANFFHASFKPTMNLELQKEVGDYWRDHMYASFMVDPLGLEHIDRIGVHNALWAADYPHPESTLGYGWTAMKQIVDAVPAHAARRILGGNAMDLFKLAA